MCRKARTKGKEPEFTRETHIFTGVSREGRAGVGSWRDGVSADAEPIAPTRRAPAAPGAGGSPVSPRCRGAEPAPKALRPHLATARRSDEPRVTRMPAERDFYNHIKQIQSSNSAESNPAASV